MNDSSHEGKLARIDGRLDKTVAGAIAVKRGGTVEFGSMAEVMQMSHLMALAQQAVPKHLRGTPGLCLGVIMQAVAWEMEPFAVAKKSYVVNDNLAYESQLIHAVIEARAPLRRRLRCKYSGEGPDRQCTVYGTFVGEDEPHEYTTPKFKDIPIKNSPLWKWDVDQQMFYLASRAWARKWCPDVLMGVYSPDEAQYAGEHAVPVQERIHNPLQDDADLGESGDERPPRQIHESESEVMPHETESGSATSTRTDDIHPSETSPPGATGGEPQRMTEDELDEALRKEGLMSIAEAEGQAPTPISARATAARARAKPRQAPAEAAGEPKPEATSQQPPTDKTHPGANAALGMAFPQPWITATRADYEAYLRRWTAAWVAYGQDPNGLRDRYSAERTIRNSLGEPVGQDALTTWKGIAAEAFKELGGQLQ